MTDADGTDTGTDRAERGEVTAPPAILCPIRTDSLYCRLTHPPA